MLACNLYLYNIKMMKFSDKICKIVFKGIDMSKKLLDCAKKLTAKKNPISIYRKLEKIMYNAGLFQEQIGLIKNIWHITNDEDLLLKISDIYANAYENYGAAYTFCNLYFQKSNPYFYEKYMTILNKKYDEFKPEFDITNYSAPVHQVIDKYTAIVYIMVYLNQEKKLDELLELIPYLSVVDSQIYECMLRLSNNEKQVYNIVRTCNNHLSELLSQNEDNYYINKFAIKLNPKNKQAYLNIIDKYVNHHKYELALELYNNQYTKEFSKVKTNSIIQFLWIINEEYASLQSYFKAVKYQKYAIDYKLEGAN